MRLVGVPKPVTRGAQAKENATVKEWRVVSASNLSALLMVLAHLVEVIRISMSDDVEQKREKFTFGEYAPLSLVLRSSRSPGASQRFDTPCKP